MSLVVVGSVAFDSIETPDGSLENALGGSAVHFSMAASYFGGVQLVGVVGEDFPDSHRQLLSTRGVCLDGLEVVKGGETFRWSGKYFDDMDQRETLSVDLNVFENFKPNLPAAYRDTGFLFLGNGAPLTQASVLDQVSSNPFTVVDTMDLWIDIARPDLEKLISRVDALVLNDEESQQLSGEKNVILAGRKIREMGPRYVIIKRGQHGALISHEEGEVALPALPLAGVVDPTGAGDSFAGGLMGCLMKSDRTDLAGLKVAVAWGTVTASFCCEGFGVQGLEQINASDLQDRFETYRGMLELDPVEIPQII
ncbi:sugar kinase [bacterium TMED181]|nr:sugar kinase [Planctomycetota bacterium]OUW44444.1 MAG: sugar kinase [bacterium TMED181]